jgi:hypothetical protein
MATPAEMITRLKNFNPTEVTFGAARVNKQGGKSIPVTYQGKKLVVQFPKTSSYGLVGQPPMDNPDGAKKYSTNLRLTNGTSFCDKLLAFEETVVDWITAHAGECLGQADQPKAVIKALFYPIVKYPKDKETGKVFYDRDPTTKLKISYWEDVWRVELFDSEGKTIFEPKMETLADPENPEAGTVAVDPTSPELAPSGTEFVGLMQCNGIWVAGGRCGVTWQLVQAQIKQPVRLAGFCIQAESDDEEEEGTETVQTSAAGAAGDAGEAGDAAAAPESADEAEAEPEVEVPKAKAPKKSRKKAAAQA